MFNLSLKSFKIISLLLFLFTVSCVGTEKNKKPVIITNDSYNPKTICDCNNDGITILNNILSKRRQFETTQSLSENKNASEYIDILKKNWKTTQYKCLKLFGSAMMSPSDCNDPKTIQSIKDQLFELGVRT